MSDFNNNQPYNWNGNDNNKSSGGGKAWAVIAIILGVVAMITFGIAFAREAGDFLYDASSSTESITDNSSTESDISAEISSDSSETEFAPEYSHDPDASVPEFTPDNDGVDLSTNLSAIYEKCAPSCCTIDVSKNGVPYSIGSGFVIDAEGGFIATNHHVIESGNEITVRFYNGDEYKATLVGSDATSDLAVLYIEAENLVGVSFGDSNNLKIGEGVVAIGTPFDITLAGTMTTGIISGIARDIEITNDYGKVIKTMTLIQTDCSINPGNSGGPLIDMAGRVIGINSMKIVDEEFEGIGFAIPISSATEIFKKLIAGEPITDSGVAVETPQIGINCFYDVETALANTRIKPTCSYPEGVFVSEIEPDSNAYAAGLARYDIITEFNGTKITNSDELANALSGLRAGDTVVITVFRFNSLFSAGSYEYITFNLDPASKFN